MAQGSLLSGIPKAWLLVTCTLISFAIGILGYALTPSNSSVAIHFSLSGEPNGWATPALAFFVIPVICASLMLIQLLTPALKPSADRLEKNVLSIVAGAGGIVLVLGQAYIFWHAV